MVVFVLYAIFMFVFLRNLAIVLVSFPTYVNVSMFSFVLCNGLSNGFLLYLGLIFGYFCEVVVCYKFVYFLL
jgi:hypothetical protein